MDKIAILVEPDFYSKHVGVRNLIFSIYMTLNKIGFDVDFLSYQVEDKSLSWLKIFIDRDSILSNFTNRNLFSEGTPRSLAESYINDKFTSLDTEMDWESAPVFSRIGSSLEFSGYSSMIISAPWVISDEMLPLALKTIGIVYDMVPNDYVFDKSHKPIVFSFQHLLGYKLYNKYCDAMWHISCATQNSYGRYFSSFSNKSYVLPPAVPCYLRNKDNSREINRNNNIVLAGPWDPRKGLYRIPKILNAVSDDLDTVYIYGRPRCTHEDVLNFFSSINENIKIVWFKEVTNKKLIEIYNLSKILIFPSENEGLGLPLIEAQLNGCRVVCTSFESALEILVSGYHLINNESDEDVASVISSMLIEDFDYDKLREDSEMFFSEEKTTIFLKSQL